MAPLKIFLIQANKSRSFDKITSNDWFSLLKKASKLQSFK